MSDTNNEVVYAKGLNIKNIPTKFGDMLSQGYDWEKFKAWGDEHVNEKGYLNLKVRTRKEPDKFGNTHSAILDTWTPEGK